MNDFETKAQQENEAWEKIESIVSECDPELQSQIKDAFYDWAETLMKLNHAASLEIYQTIQERQLQTTGTEQEIS